MSNSQTKQLLDTVIEQQLDLSEYKEKLPTILHSNFVIQCKEGCHKINIASAGHLVDEIIKWENGTQYDSLEATLNQKFNITGKLPRIG